jgi:hypothetical protein
MLKASRAPRAPASRRKKLLYGLFIGLNVLWFACTVLFVGRGASPDAAPLDAAPGADAGWGVGAATDEFPFGEPLSVRKARAEVIAWTRRTRPSPPPGTSSTDSVSGKEHPPAGVRVST